MNIFCVYRGHLYSWYLTLVVYKWNWKYEIFDTATIQASEKCGHRWVFRSALHVYDQGVKLPSVILRCCCPRYHENTLGPPMSWSRPSFLFDVWIWHICVHWKSSNCWFTFYTSSRVFPLRSAWLEVRASLMKMRSVCFDGLLIYDFWFFFHCCSFWSYLYIWWI